MEKEESEQVTRLRGEKAQRSNIGKVEHRKGRTAANCPRGPLTATAAVRLARRLEPSTCTCIPSSRSLNFRWRAQALQSLAWTLLHGVPPAIVHGVLIFGIVQFAESQAEERRAREP